MSSLDLTIWMPLYVTCKTFITPIYNDPYGVPFEIRGRGELMYPVYRITSMYREKRDTECKGIVVNDYYGGFIRPVYFSKANTRRYQHCCFSQSLVKICTQIFNRVFFDKAWVKRRISHASNRMQMSENNAFR